MKLAELVATLSLVSDLGMGRPTERVLRQTVIALRLADAIDAPADVRAATYYTSLLSWVGCATDTTDVARLFGDETRVYADTHAVDLGGMTMAAFVAAHLAGDRGALERAAAVGRFVLNGGRSVHRLMRAHCLATGELADRLSLGPDVRQPLLQVFERWDGRGVPGAVRGTNLHLPTRLVHLADVAEAMNHTGGPAEAARVIQERRGTQFDPALVDVFLQQVDELLAGVEEMGAWGEVIALDPRLGEELTADNLNRSLEAFGDFADLKSPYFLGHSRGVADLAAAAGADLGMPASDVVMLRRAGLVHDVGMIGVPSGVWDERRPWSLTQAERARTHPYLTERMLAHTPMLAAVARCAALHHERLDGSGYPRGAAGDAIPLAARVLAAADVRHALTEDRPHRRALGSADVEAAMGAEVREGRLDGPAVNAVLAAAGHRRRHRPELPRGLTARESEVLVCLARGRSNPEIAADLHVSRKTVSSHLEHIYSKLGVSTRVEAALFAMRHGLVAASEF